MLIIQQSVFDMVQDINWKTDEIGPENVVITDRHISSMNQKFDSAICDFGTANAVAIALTDHYRTPVRVSVSRGKAFMIVDGKKTRLHSSLVNVLERLSRGLSIKKGIYPIKHLGGKSAKQGDFYPHNERFSAELIDF